MPTPIQPEVSFPGAAGGRYDDTHTWQNANDRVSYERSFRLDPVELAKIQSALITANPATPQDLIRDHMTVHEDPPLPSYDAAAVTVDDCFAPDLGHVNDYAPTNWSGRLGEFQGSSVPSLPPW